MGYRLAAVFLLIPVLGQCGPGRIEAPPPPRELAEPDSLPSFQAGTIVAPLSVDLESALAALERIVPDQLGDLGTRLPLPLKGSKRASFAFEVRRDPFDVTFARDTIRFAATLHYRGRAWLTSSIGPTLSGDCGIDDEPRRARLVLRVVPGLTDQWQLSVKTRLAQLTALTPAERDRCVVTFLRVNVTEKVLGAARGALESRLPMIRQRIAAVDVRTPLEHLWGELQKPIRLADSVWLLLHPESVHLGPIKGSRRTVSAILGITAAPRILTGPMPVLPPVPLPPLGKTRMDEGFILGIEGALDYAVMSAELSRRLKGQSVKAGGGEFRVQSVNAFGIGGGRVALGLDFDGTARGRIWFTGTPSYDPVTSMITVPDLDFDARSAGMLVQGVAWIKGGAIRDFLREHARVSAGELLDRLQALAVKELNRSLARGVELSATIGASEPAGIQVRPQEIIVRARAVGSARLLLGPEVFPKP